MAKFLNARSITAETETIINNSQKLLVLISPFLILAPISFKNLQSADRRSITTILIYGKDGLMPEIYGQLDKLLNLKIYFNKNLHAKCYFNEQDMVITSMNLYEFSENNNREMGVLINKKEDEQAYKAALGEFFVILNEAVPKNVRETAYKITPSFREKTTPDNGHSVLDCLKELFPDTVPVRKVAYRL